MSDNQMLYCLIAFILGWLVYKHMGDGFSVGILTNCSTVSPSCLSQTILNKLVDNKNQPKKTSSGIHYGKTFKINDNTYYKSYNQGGFQICAGTMFGGDNKCLDKAKYCQEAGLLNDICTTESDFQDKITTALNNGNIG